MAAVGNLLLPNDFGFVFSSDTTLEYILLFNVILGQMQASGKMVRCSSCREEEGTARKGERGASITSSWGRCRPMGRW